MRFIAIHFQWGVQVYILYINLILGLYLNIYIPGANVHAQKMWLVD